MREYFLYRIEMRTESKKWVSAFFPGGLPIGVCSSRDLVFKYVGMLSRAWAVADHGKFGDPAASPFSYRIIEEHIEERYL